MNCTNCGYQNNPGVNFCENCGSDLRAASQPQGGGQTVRYCPGCGAENRGSAQFCSSCGTSFTGSVPTPPVQSELPPQAPPAPQVVVVNQEEDKKKKRNRLLLPLLFLLLAVCLCCGLPYMVRGASPGSADFFDYYAGWIGSNSESSRDGQISPAEPDTVQQPAQDNPDTQNTAPQQAGVTGDDSGQGDSCGFAITNVQIHSLSVTALNAYSDGEQSPSVLSFAVTSTGPWDEYLNEFELRMGPPRISGYDWMVADCWAESLDKIMCDGPGWATEFAGVDNRVRNIEKFELCVDCTDDCGYYYTFDNPAFDPVAIGADTEDDSVPGDDDSAGVELAGPPTIIVSEATMCRKGPGKGYAGIGDLQPGEAAEILGQYADGDYWVIENYGVGGECWLSGYYAETQGNTNDLPFYDAPALPKQNITFNLQNKMNEKFVCELYIAPAGSGDYSVDLLGSLTIPPQSSQSVSFSAIGSTFDLWVVSCQEGSFKDHFEYSVPLSNGANYPFKP